MFHDTYANMTSCPPDKIWCQSRAKMYQDLLLLVLLYERWSLGTRLSYIHVCVNSIGTICGTRWLVYIQGLGFFAEIATFIKLSYDIYVIGIGTCNNFGGGNAAYAHMRIRETLARRHPLGLFKKKWGPWPSSYPPLLMPMYVPVSEHIAIPSTKTCIRTCVFNVTQYQLCTPHCRLSPTLLLWR